VAAQPPPARGPAVRHEVIKGIRDYFDSHGFVLVDTPIFTPAACEGTIDAVRSGLFRRRKGLSHAVRPAL
jgi:aspartyl/asparaginyl-tRNA synthetase